MGGSKREVQAELEMGVPELIQYLESLVTGLKQGHIYLQHGEQDVMLAPSSPITLEIEAKQKKDKDKLSLELSWRRQPVREGSPGLQISSHPGEDQ